MPVTFQPRRRPERVTARMTAFSPGASPPPVLTRTCILTKAISWPATSCNKYGRETFAKSRIADRHCRPGNNAPGYCVTGVGCGGSGCGGGTGSGAGQQLQAQGGQLWPATQAGQAQAQPPPPPPPPGGGA